MTGAVQHTPTGVHSKVCDNVTMLENTSPQNGDSNYRRQK